MNKWIRENRGFLVVLLTFGLFRSAVATWNPVPTGSMRPTVQEGDVVLVNRLAYDLKLPLTNIILAHTGEPARGDIVTFSSPIDGTQLLKRIVALPGDTVEMRGKVVFVNGRAADYRALESVSENDKRGFRGKALHLHEQLGAESHVVQWLEPLRDTGRDSFGPLVVPPGQFLMLGDNRDNSADSRYFGLVQRRLLIGRTRTILVAADIRNDWTLRFERFGARLD